MADHSGADPVQRLRLELADLTTVQRNELQWRSIMRLMQIAEGSLAAPNLVDVLRRLLVARLFMDGQLDASAVQSVAAQPINFVRPFSPGRSTNVLSKANLLLDHLLGSRGHFSAVEEAIASFGMPNLVPDGHFVLDDIRQIKSGASAAWHQVRPLSFANLPFYFGNHSLRTQGKIHPFWVGWYQQVIDGRPPNWPLLRDVALIDDAVWQAGGATLDHQIDLIHERHRLLEEVRRLKAELATAGLGLATGAIAHRGHNNPPELLSDESFSIAAVQIIPMELDDAEHELQQQQPSPSRLRQIGTAIRNAANSVLAYCAGLGDEVLKAAAKEVGTSVGKWAGVGLVGYLVSHSQAFEALAQALIRLADKL